MSKVFKNMENIFLNIKNKNMKKKFKSTKLGSFIGNNQTFGRQLILSEFFFPISTSFSKFLPFFINKMSDETEYSKS